MKEKDIHILIEQQNPEVKQRIWERVVSNTPELAELITVVEKAARTKTVNLIEAKKRS